MTEATYDGWEFDLGLPDLPPRNQHNGNLNSNDLISLDRLKANLVYIAPEDRDEWRNTIFAIREARVLNSDRSMVDAADLCALADQWSSGELWASWQGPKPGNVSIGNYTGGEDVEGLFFGAVSDGANKVRLGSLIKSAQDSAKRAGASYDNRLARSGAAELAERLQLTASGPAIPASDRVHVTAAGLVNPDPPTGSVGQGAGPVEQDGHRPGVGKGASDEWTLGHFKFRTQAALRRLPPVQWLIPDALPLDATAFLVGHRGSYKTFVALDMALSVAVGSAPGNNRIWPTITKPGAVLYMAGEGQSGIAARIDAWTQHHNGGKDVENFILADNVPKIGNLDKTQELADAIKLMAAEIGMGGFRLIVLDTVSRAMAGFNSSSPEFASQYTELCDCLRRSCGVANENATILSLHHPSKGKQVEASGAHTFEADASTVLIIDNQDKAAHTVQINMTKQKDGEEWAKPLAIALRSIQVNTAGDTSLVVAKPTPAEAKKAEETPNERRGGKGPAPAWDLIEVAAAVEAHFREFGPSRRETMNSLAAATSQRLADGHKDDPLYQPTGTQTLRKKVLPALIEQGNKFYDASIRGWSGRCLMNEKAKA